MASKIRLKCDGCERSLSVDAAKAGKKIRCPDCQAVLTIPQAEASEDDASAGTKKIAKPAGARSQNTSENSSRPRRSSEEFDETQDVPKRRKRAAVNDGDDIWSQPMSSYSSPAIEDHEYEQLGLPPKRQRVQENTSDSGEMSLKVPMMIFGVGLLIGVISIGMAFGAPSAGRIVSFPAIGLGAILSLWGHWTIRANAFNESKMCGFLYVWCFPYSMYYIFSRFSENKIPFLASVLGNVILVVGITGMVIADIRLEKAAEATPAVMNGPVVSSAIFVA